jgi:hypothetical protein
MEYKNAESDWMPAPTTVKSGLPVSDEGYIKNVRNNCLLDLQNLNIQKEHGKTMIMVCGGPTAKQFLNEIKEKRKDPNYVIFCSNKTHDWLISEGVIPDYQFIIDPKPSKIDDIKNPHKDITYIIGISCDTTIFKALEGYKVLRAFSVSGIGKPSDMEIIKVLFPYEKIAYLFGGTMAGLRAMSLADIMGFKKVEFYGFDSCYFETDENNDPIYYSYDKKRKENILEVECATGEKFLTSPVFASQATQFIKWKQRYEYIDFTIHGYSLTSVINNIENERQKPKHDLLITEYSKNINKELHKKEALTNDFKDAYGLSGQTYAGWVSLLIGQLLKKYNNITLLDYGCGKRTLENTLPPIIGLTVNNYDPCIDEYSEIPKPSDLVVCTDVLEHVEHDCLENVLNDLKRVTKKALFLSISTRIANKSYSDGQNCHNIVHDYDWWKPKLMKRFFIVDYKIIPNDKFICILQSKDIER